MPAPDSNQAPEGSVCLVTGANSGIGLETARGLARRGFTVVMTARDAKRGQAAVEDVRRSTGRQQVELLALDLARLASVREAAREFGERHSRLDLLVNNAGVVLGDRRTTDDGFEATFGVNHLGHFLLTTELVPILERTGTPQTPARVVNVASDAHRVSSGLDFDDLMYESRSYSAIKAYGDSKLANILFTTELARRLKGRNVLAHAVHPGVVRTQFGKDGDTGGVLGLLTRIAGPFILTPAKGARTSIHVATSSDALSSSGDYWSKQKRRTPNPAARDAKAASKLWARSEKLVGLI